MIHWSNELKNVKTQLNNVYTKNQSDGRYIKVDNDGSTTVNIRTQGQAYFQFEKIQPNTGFRNYAGIKYMVRNGEAAESTTIFSFESRDVNNGVFMSCENNKFSFTNPTTFNNAIVNLPTQNKHIASKEYVDSKALRLSNVSTNNISLLRVDFGEQTGAVANGRLLKITLTNQDNKNFVKRCITAKTPIDVVFTYRSNHIVVSGCSVMGSNGDILLGQLPGLWSQAELNELLNKQNITDIRIRTLG